MKITLELVKKNTTELYYQELREYFCVVVVFEWQHRK